MSKRRFRISSDLDCEITVDVDLQVLTPQLATEINSFWCGADEVLKASGGDVVEAVVRRAAGELFRSVMTGLTPAGAELALGQIEGWPVAHGVTVVDVDMPDFDLLGMEVDEIEP